MPALRRAIELARRLWPWALLVACAVLIADEALAQSTGGSFGGGSFGGGGGGGGGSYSGGGGSSGGGDDGGGDLIAFILYVLFSRLPWPLKIGLVVLGIGVWGAFKLFRRKRDE